MAIPHPKGLTVYVFNVGQGDHLLIEFPNGEYGIIDFYHQSLPPLNLYSPPALSFLKQRHAARPSKPIRLRFVHLTHPDLDHTKGVIEFLEWVVTEDIKLHEFWMFPGLDFKRVVELFNKALQSLPASDKKVRYRAQEIHNRLKRLSKLIQKTRCDVDKVVGVNQMAVIGKDTRVVAVAPLASQVDRTNDKVLTKLFTLILQGKLTSSSYNNLMSSVIKIKYGKHSLLFGGDTHSRVWEDCLNHYRRTKQTDLHGKCEGNFIKVSHHGSKSSSSIKLWRALLCDDTRLVVSAGRTRRPKHPDPRTLKDIIRAGTKLGVPPEIVSTNMCSECLHPSAGAKAAHRRGKGDSGNGHFIRKPADIEIVNWFSQPASKPSKEVEQVTRRVRARGAVVKPHQPEFAGYIYKFSPDLDDSEVKLINAVTTKKLTHSPCLYRNKPREKFPKCVYR